MGYSKLPRTPLRVVGAAVSDPADKLTDEAARPAWPGKYPWFANVIADPELSRAELATAMFLWDHQRGGVAWPSYKTIADFLDVTVRTIMRAVAKLEARGHLERQRRTGKSGRNTSNRYSLTINRQKQLDDEWMRKLERRRVT